MFGKHGRWRIAGKNPSTHGFTLIELLIVMAIISLLATILFPVFARARENARRTSCLNNMKQIGIGMLQYAQDYDERYYGSSKVNPAFGQAFVDFGRGTGWAGGMFPYVKSTQVYKCPNDTNKGNGANQPVSYALNYYASSTHLANHAFPALGVLFSEISGSSVNISNLQETSSPEYSAIDNGDILIWVTTAGIPACCRQGAAIYHTRGAGVLDFTKGRLKDDDEFGPQPTQPRHFAGANYAFLDGHAKWVHPQSVRSFQYSYGPVSPGHAYIKATDTTGAAYYSAE